MTLREILIINTINKHCNESCPWGVMNLHRNERSVAYLFGGHDNSLIPKGIYMYLYYNICMSEVTEDVLACLIYPDLKFSVSDDKCVFLWKID